MPNIKLYKKIKDLEKALKKTSTEITFDFMVSQLFCHLHV